MKLDFIVPGFSKCGTTTLCSLLAEHPEICIPPEHKEPCYFQRQDYELYRAWYESLFFGAGEGKKLGEGSTIYSVTEYEKVARDRIKKDFPDVKLIFIARDPITRIESSYRFIHHEGHNYAVECSYTIGEAVRELNSLIEDTLYWSRLSNYLESFERNNIHIVLMEDLSKEPGKVMEECFKFLEVDSSIVLPDLDRRLNEGGSKYYDSRQLRKMRNVILEPETGKPLSEIPLHIQDQFLPDLGLRIPFDKSTISWNEEDLLYIKDSLLEDITTFIDFIGLKKGVWKRFEELVLL